MLKMYVPFSYPRDSDSGTLARQMLFLISTYGILERNVQKMLEQTYGQFKKLVTWEKLLDPWWMSSVCPVLIFRGLLSLWRTGVAEKENVTPYSLQGIFRLSLDASLHLLCCTIAAS